MTIVLDNTDMGHLQCVRTSVAQDDFGKSLECKVPERLYTLVTDILLVSDTYRRGTKKNVHKPEMRKNLLCLKNGKKTGWNGKKSGSLRSTQRNWQLDPYRQC